MDAQSLPDMPRRINIGCGYDKRPGFLNIDVDPACTPDILVKPNDYSALRENWFEHIVAMDVLEHISRAHTGVTLLEWNSLLTMGGTLDLHTSDVLGIAKLLHARPRYVDQAGVLVFMYGNQAHPGDFHLTGFTETTLRVHLIAAGFSVDSLTVLADWVFAVEAHKVDSWTALLDQPLSTRDFVMSAWNSALNRDPDPAVASWQIEEIDAGRMGKRGVLKELFSSEEHRCVVADRHGF